MPARRGGWRQRLRAPNFAPVPQAIHRGAARSHFCDRILELWAQGFISAPTVQYLTEGALLGGATNPLIQQLAKIGSSGRWQNNCHRDIQRNFFADVDMPQITCIQVHGKDAKNPPTWLRAHGLLRFVPSLGLLCNCKQIQEGLGSGRWW